MARAIKTDAAKAVGYLRVSTDEQHLGPEAQRAAIDAWAAREGVEVIAWHADVGVSGAMPIEGRPGLLAALASIREHGAGVLVVAKRDRIARDVVVAALADRAASALGARLIAADGTANGDTPADAFMRTMIDGAAAYERGQIRARTKAALAVKKARGERVGAVPFGHRLAVDGRTLVPDDDELAVLERVRVLRASGVSVRGIVAALAAEGLVSRSGRPFTKGSVENMLARVAPVAA
jgi:DNA invertase Pin-like site-specific DNA recombinase